MRSNRRAVLQIGLSELLGLVLSIILVILIVLLAARLIGSFFGESLEEAGSRTAFVTIAKDINDLSIKGDKFATKKPIVKLFDEHLIVLFDAQGKSKIDKCSASWLKSWVCGCDADTEEVPRPLACQEGPCVCLYKFSGCDTTCMKDFKPVDCIKTPGMHRAYTLDYWSVMPYADGLPSNTKEEQAEKEALTSAYKNMLGQQVPIPGEYPKDLPYPYRGAATQLSNPFIFGECDGWGDDAAFGTRQLYIEKLELPVNGVRTNHFLITIDNSIVAGREAILTQRFSLTLADLKEAYEQKQYAAVIGRADEMVKVPNQKPETLAELSYWYTKAQLAIFREERKYRSGHLGVYGALYGFLGAYPEHERAPEVLAEALTADSSIYTIYDKEYLHDVLQNYAFRMAELVAKVKLDEQQSATAVKHFTDLFRNIAASTDANFWLYWAGFSGLPYGDLREIYAAAQSTLATFKSRFPASPKLAESQQYLTDALLTVLAAKPSGRTSLVDIIDSGAPEDAKRHASDMIGAICESDHAAEGPVKLRCAELKAAGKYGVR